MIKQIAWILKQHTETNHMYDTYLPYEFHLRMVKNVAKQFINEVPDSNDGETSFILSMRYLMKKERTVKNGQTKNITKELETLRVQSSLNLPIGLLTSNIQKCLNLECLKCTKKKTITS